VAITDVEHVTTNTSRIYEAQFPASHNNYATQRKTRRNGCVKTTQSLADRLAFS